jgi:hypothetical protein
METPPVEGKRDATIARRAQLRRSISTKLNSQQTNASGKATGKPIEATFRKLAENPAKCCVFRFTAA